MQKMQKHAGYASYKSQSNGLSVGVGYIKYELNGLPRDGVRDRGRIFPSIF